MPTGQYPRRRETDQQAALRVARTQAHAEQAGRPVPTPWAAFKVRFSAAGKVVRAWQR
jgi:hypothetical protein